MSVSTLVKATLLEITCHGSYKLFNRDVINLRLFFNEYVTDNSD